MITFADGFHGPESENGLPFRWMQREAHLQCGPLAAPAFLDLQVCCHFDDLSQHLAIEAAGASERFELAHGWNSLTLALPAGTAAVTLRADRVVPLDRHPGDGRELAVQVRPPLLHHDAARHARAGGGHAASITAAREGLASPLAGYLSSSPDLRYEHGFHHPERGDGLVLRWTERRARLSFDARPEPRFIELWVHTHFHDLSQRLTLAAEGAPPEDVELVHGWQPVSVLVPGGATRVDLAVSRPFPAELHPDDPRELGVQVRPPFLHGDERRHEHVARQQRNRVLNRHETLAGALELRSFPPKLGIDITGVCNIKPACVYCEWDRAKEMEGPNVEVPFNLDTLRELGPFFEESGELVNCSIGEPFMMKEIDPLLDAFGARGKLLELTTNGQILTDTNIKKLLGRYAHLYISLDAATPETYAKLRNERFKLVVENVRRLVNAKGGPGRLPLIYLVFMPMRANVHEAEAFVGLCAELRIDRLVLRPLNPSPGISLNFTRAGYKYDYQKELLPFDELVRVSGRVAELCARLGVELSDQMDFGDELRASFAAEFEAGRREIARAFDARAAIPAATSAVVATPVGAAHVAAAVDAAAASSTAAPARSAEARAAVTPGAETTPETSRPSREQKAAGDAPAPAVAMSAPSDPVPRRQPVALPTLGHEHVPVCTEPWTSLYVLRRGTMPCCYGGAPLAPMADFKQAWNAPLMQAIRRELAAGRFHRYCFDSPDCPIVRKHAEAHDLSAGQQALLGSRRWLAALKRLSLGWASRAYRAGRRAAARFTGDDGQRPATRV